MCIRDSVWIVALGFVSVFGFEIDLSSLGLKTKGLLGKIEWRRSNRNNSSLDSARDDGYDENDGYDLEDEDENEVETEPTIVPPIRRRIQRPVLDVDDVDEEPATILPRKNGCRLFIHIINIQYRTLYPSSDRWNDGGLGLYLVLVFVFKVITVILVITVIPSGVEGRIISVTSSPLDLSKEPLCLKSE